MDGRLEKAWRQISKENESQTRHAGYAQGYFGQEVDVGIIRYSYIPQPAGAADLSNTELYAKTARAFGPVVIAGSLYYSPNGMSNAGASWYRVVSGAWQVQKHWSISSLIGR